MSNIASRFYKIAIEMANVSEKKLVQFLATRRVVVPAHPASIIAILDVPCAGCCKP